MFEMMLKDVAMTKKNYIGNRIGSENRKFAQFTQRFFMQNKPDRTKVQSFINQLTDFDQTAGNSKIKPGFQQLSIFSEFLD